jgi:hypothetical protein
MVTTELAGLTMRMGIEQMRSSSTPTISHGYGPGIDTRLAYGPLR